jgi:hypothetical protein
MLQTIEAIYFNWKDKSGKPYTNRKGENQCRIVIKTNETGKIQGGDKGASAFVLSGNPALEWKVGDTLDIFMKPSDDGQFLNFDAPKGTLPKKDIGYTRPNETTSPLNPPGPTRDMKHEEIIELLHQIKDAVMPPELSAKEVFENTK